MAPLACGSYAGGDSSTVCTPNRSATRPAQIDQRGLVVGLEQGPPVVPEPSNARHSLAHCAVVQSTLAQHRVRQNGSGVAALDH
eukprot:1012150-Alexandrium_andersonii.AAC.1